VIALGVPVPLYEGNPLDPPLRSRFSCRLVLPLSAPAMVAELTTLAPSLDRTKLRSLVASVGAPSCSFHDSRCVGEEEAYVDRREQCSTWTHTVLTSSYTCWITEAMRNVGKSAPAASKDAAPLTTAIKPLPFFPCNGLARVTSMLRHFPGNADFSQPAFQS
jgi:hypothetical protein